MEKYTILAPHPDDELIGCYTLLSSRLVHKVYYFDGEDRKEEAENCSRIFGSFDYEFIKPAEAIEKLSGNVEGILLMPDPSERHPLHKKVSQIGLMVVEQLKINYGFYSTEMTASYVWELDEKLKWEKKKCLELCYPSQRSLWENDWRYWLFEGIVVVRRWL